MNKFFLDASYAIALSAVTDQYHQKAELLAKQIETEAIPLITTMAVVPEFGNALSRVPYRAAAIVRNGCSSFDDREI